MFELLNLALAGGLAAAAAPLIIHLMRRRKVRQVTWGAMRFLQEVLAKSRKRLLVDELLLLLVRTLIAALVALVFLRPALKQDETPADNPRLDRTASVLLIDDSLSSGAGRGEIALDRMKRLARSYLQTLAPGDEISLITMSRLRGTAADPFFDLEAVEAMVGNLQPTAAASDIPALLEAGMVQLGRHINPGAELVLVTDAFADGWNAADQARWDDVRLRLQGPPGATLGSRQKPRLLILSPPSASVTNNLAVTALATDRTLVSAGKPVGLRVGITSTGSGPARPVSLRLLADGQPVDRKTLEISPGAEEATTFTHTFPDSGEHLLTVAIEEAGDGLSADDSRSLALQVADPVAVLLVEGGSGEGFEGKLGFVAAALDPAADGKSQFRLTKTTPDRLDENLIAAHRVVVLGDVPPLPANLVDALERHVLGGGGILFGVGPLTDPKQMNLLWSKGGEGLSPASLGKRNELVQGSPVSRSTTSHPALQGLGDEPGESLTKARFKTWFDLDVSKGKTGGLTRLLLLDNGSPVLALRRRGLGLSALWTTTLNGEWNDLPVHPAYVPVMRSVVGHLASFVMPPRNLRPGENIGVLFGNEATATGPDGKAVKLTPGSWEGRPAMVSEPLLAPGGYSVADGPKTARFAVACAPDESRLVPVPAADVSQCLSGLKFQSLSDEAAIAANFSRERRSTEIWRWLLGAVVLLLFLETFLTRREAGLGPRSLQSKEAA